MSRIHKRRYALTISGYKKARVKENEMMSDDGNKNIPSFFFLFLISFLIDAR